MVEKPIYPDRPQLPPKTGMELAHEEVAALRAQVVQLAQRVAALEKPPRPQPEAVTTVFDWED
jgi:ubiquinone biosynthesis protein UbiJ